MRAMLAAVFLILAIGFPNQMQGMETTAVAVPACMRCLVLLGWRPSVYQPAHIAVGLGYLPTANADLPISLIVTGKWPNQTALAPIISEA